MKLKVGIIVHELFTNKMLESIRHSSFHDLDFYVRYYSHEDDSVKLTRELNPLVDMILYGGPVPYYISKQAAPIMVPADYVSHDEVSLMRTLFELEKNSVDLTRLSVDTLPENTLRDVYDELQLDAENIVLKPLMDEKIKDDYETFHLENYRTGKTRFAVTCRALVYERLLREGIPCHHMVATKASVIHTLQQMVTAYQRCKYQDAQLAIGLIKVKSSFYSHENSLNSRRHQIEIQQHLLNYAEKLKAGMTDLGDGLFLFYTTYGVLKGITHSFQEIPLLEPMRNEELSICIGIGTGDNASIAEDRARKALQKAEKHGEGTGFIMLDHQEILGPFGKSPSKIIIRTESPHLQSLAKELGMTTTTLAHLIRLGREGRRYNFTAEELAAEVGLSPRSARRILSHLHGKGLAELVGEEMAAVQGRPKKIYRIQVPSLDVEAN